MAQARAHPYIPNSAPAVKRAMLEAVGARDVDELYASIPQRLRLARPLDLPPAMPSEIELRRELEGLLARNTSCREALSFLGGGCWNHYVPAVVDEVVNRAEFVTAYYGDTYTDHGKLQAFFEYASLIGELVELDAVSQPTYDWATAAASAIAMAGRVTGRSRALIPASLAPERRRVLEGVCAPALQLDAIPFDAGSGQLDLDALRAALDADVACVYLENPGFLGVLEAEAPAVMAAARAAGALGVVGVDPISLGVLEAPPRYGADIVCGELQPLGVHMHFGGGVAGFIATPDEERFVAEFPTFLIGLTRSEQGEWAFGEVAWERTSYVQRGESRDYAGTTQGLWAIAAAVYLSLLGPVGLAELGEGLVQRARYAASRLGELPGVRAPRLSGPCFKEVVVGFDESGRSVAEINAALRAQGIYGGHDLSRDFPELGQSALYCFTEQHTQADIDRLVGAVAAATA
jgi:glycine dehydrogenase subunit 1